MLYMLYMGRVLFWRPPPGCPVYAISFHYVCHVCAIFDIYIYIYVIFAIYAIYAIYIYIVYAIYSISLHMPFGLYGPYTHML